MVYIISLFNDCIETVGYIIFNVKHDLKFTQNNNVEVIFKTQSSFLAIQVDTNRSERGC